MFSCLEISLRIFGPRYYEFNNNSNEYYTNPRGYHIPIRKEGRDIIYGLNYIYDERGYRLPDKSCSEKANKKNSEIFILGLGDSFTFGQGVKYGDIYLTILEDLLNQGGLRVFIRNCGLNGLDTEAVLETYIRESSQTEYSLVIYGFVLNDFGLSGPEISGNNLLDFSNGKYSFNALRKICLVYNFFCYLTEKRKLHTITVKAYLDAFTGKSAEEKFKVLGSLNQKIEAKKSKLVILLFPLLYNFNNYQFREIHHKISSFCKSNDIILLDLLPEFSKYKAEDLWVNPTDHHPNEIAHRIAAKKLYEILNRNKLLYN